MKKLALMIAFLLMAQLSMSAAYSIVVYRVDGSEQAFLLEKKPVMTFNDSEMLVGIDGNTLAISRDDINNMEFVDNYSSLTLPARETIEIVDGTTFRFPTAGDIAVYDIAGRSVKASIATDGETATVSVASCPAGVYVIAYNNKSFKIVKK